MSRTDTPPERPSLLRGVVVAAVAGVGRDAAEAALSRSGGAVKPAILVARGMAPDMAKARLAETGGLLAPLI